MKPINRPPNEMLIAEARARFASNLTLSVTIKTLVLSLADALEEASRPPATNLTDREKLLKDLDISQRITLSALADTYEEAGEPDMAAAIRWLIQEQKWPGHVQYKFRWSEDKGYGANSFSLPRPVLLCLEGDKIVKRAGGLAIQTGGESARFRSPSSALVAAAKALLVAYKKDQEQPKPLPPHF